MPRHPSPQAAQLNVPRTTSLLSPSPCCPTHPALSLPFAVKYSIVPRSSVEPRPPPALLAPRSRTPPPKPHPPFPLSPAPLLNPKAALSIHTLHPSPAISPHPLKPSHKHPTPPPPYPLKWSRRYQPTPSPGAMATTRRSVRFGSRFSVLVARVSGTREGERDKRGGCDTRTLRRRREGRGTGKSRPAHTCVAVDGVKTMMIELR